MLLQYAVIWTRIRHKTDSCSYQVEFSPDFIKKETKVICRYLSHSIIIHIKHFLSVLKVSKTFISLRTS